MHALPNTEEIRHLAPFENLAHTQIRVISTVEQAQQFKNEFFWL